MDNYASPAQQTVQASISITVIMILAAIITVTINVASS